jgi:hypothetical protein
MTSIAEEPRARAIRHYHECIVGYLLCHHRSPALVNVQESTGIQSQGVQQTHDTTRTVENPETLSVLFFHSY